MPARGVFLSFFRKISRFSPWFPLFFPCFVGFYYEFTPFSPARFLLISREFSTVGAEFTPLSRQDVDFSTAPCYTVSDPSDAPRHPPRPCNSPWEVSIMNHNNCRITVPEIPVFFSTDDNYIPFLDVALSSLIENA
jgi:hypothetical protein